MAWCSTADVGRLVKVAHHISDVEAAGKRLVIRITAPDVVMQRASTAVEKIDRRIVEAQPNNSAGFLNRECP